MAKVYKVVLINGDKFLSYPLGRAQGSSFYYSIPGGRGKYILEYKLGERTSAVKNTPGIFVFDDIVKAKEYKNSQEDLAFISLALLECNFRGPMIKVGVSNFKATDILNVWQSAKAKKSLTRRKYIDIIKQKALSSEEDEHSVSVASVVPIRRII